ncbi:uncharacterized protein LOC107371144 [Tetranychus urticae]|nr:uncharacterized protein LOC107371144 [Tetranychus urticae]
MEYQLDECIKWIQDNGYESLAVQLDQRSIAKSIGLIMCLQSKLPSVKFSLIVSDSCSFDLLATQHLGDGMVDGLIKFGDTCLAPVSRDIDELPIFMIFGDFVDSSQWQFTVDSIEELKKTTNPDNNDKWLVLFSTNHVELVKRLTNKLSWLEPAKLINFSFNWEFTESHKDFIHKDVNAICPDFGAFRIPNDFDKYSKILFIGSQLNLYLRLVPGLTHIDPEKRIVETRQGQKLLSKRIGLIERLKRKKTLNLGFLITNAFPSIDEYMEKTERIKKKNHKINRILLINSTDECKLGNFANLDAFVLINGCKCTKFIDKLDLHLPILTYKEYEILCGCKTQYGGVEWNQENSIDDEEDETTELSTNEQNQLIESEVLVKDTWYGLTINPAYQPLSFAKHGQSGKASGYSNEPI